MLKSEQKAPPVELTPAMKQILWKLYTVKGAHSSLHDSDSDTVETLLEVGLIKEDLSRMLYTLTKEGMFCAEDWCDPQLRR